MEAGIGGAGWSGGRRPRAPSAASFQTPPASPPPAEARAAQPLPSLRDAKGSARARAFRAWRPRAESPR